MGSKQQRQNQHISRLMRKIARFKKKGLNVDGLEKELAYSSGETTRPEFATGQAADSRVKKRTTNYSIRLRKDED